MENQDAYKDAKKRVEDKIDFYRHVIIYVGVNILLIIINLVTSSEYLWFKWPLIGWGIGILAHAFNVYAFPFGSSFKERMIKKEIEKEAGKKSGEPM